MRRETNMHRGVVQMPRCRDMLGSRNFSTKRPSRYHCHMHPMSPTSNHQFKIDQSFSTCHKLHGLISSQRVVGAKNRRSRQGSFRQWGLRGFSARNKIRGSQEIWGSWNIPRGGFLISCLRLAQLYLYDTLRCSSCCQKRVEASGVYPRYYRVPRPRPSFGPFVGPSIFIA
jgi:hypothetical protein